MSEKKPDAPANRLIHSTSPYLLQHARNPVDWHQWGEEALALARSEDKPILLSIGYSACHWCHVMAHESFEDPEIAAVMNRHFVPIKVDREERPDLDDIYMAATLAMNRGQGGWPMTVFLTPEQEPFFAGTYFPPTDRWGRPGFRSLLEQIAEAWKKDRAGIRAQGGQLVEHLRQNSRAAPGPAVGEAELLRAESQLEDDFDRTYGGFGSAPKFPPSAALSLLLRCSRRFSHPASLEMVKKTLDEMARGGMYDQIGGGFHRYSVDERWLVPHFEKMLYDNALLARVYLEGYQATSEPFYREVATQVLDYVLLEMTSAEGGFYSATDADSEGEEGKFFVWTPAEVEQVLGEEEARRLCAWYDVSDEGNWEGKSILHVTRTLPEVAARLGIKAEALEQSIRAARPRLYQARLARVAPGLDDKVLTAWNGLMISAFAEAARVLGDPRYLAAAEKAARFLLGTLRREDGRLLRTYRAGHAHLAAYLEDYAYLADALLDLYEAGADRFFLDEAERLAGLIRSDFAAEDGGFFSTASNHESLIVRPREGHDGAVPSANAVAASALARLSYHLDREDLRGAASAALRAYARAMTRSPRAFSRSLAVVDLLLDGPVELALVGPPAGLEPLRRELARAYLPNRILAHNDPTSGASTLPLLAGKGLLDGKPALYVCRNFACQRPISDPALVAAALEDRPAAPETPARTLSARQAGSATPAGTAAYAARFPATGFGPLGSTGLTVSKLGFGGYRIDDETAAHHQALQQALQGGCNLIDTSTNYTDGSSEQLIGEVLAELARSSELPREQVVVVSKAGYVQGQNLEHAMERERVGRPFPEMVKYGDGIWHCIHPEFLADQLDRSLDRLGLARLDVLLLHNVEYYLSDAHERSHGTLDKRREEFYQRLGAAFVWLEAQVAAGRIGCYGVSSNTVAAAASDPEATSLQKMLETAQSVAGAGHHFRVLQLPMNLFESNPVLGDVEPTVLELAQKHNLGVLVNRPLNAMHGNGMVRLADPVTEGGEAIDLEGQLTKLATLEQEYRERIAVHLQASEGGMPPEQLFTWSQDLRGLDSQVQSLEHWEQLEAQRIVPRLMSVVRALDEAMHGAAEDTWRTWRTRYLPEMRLLLEELRRRAGERSQARSNAVAAALDPVLPEQRRGESLSRKALWVLTSTPGVSTVLVGMRKPEYVDDALAVLSWPPIPDAAECYQAIQDVALPG